jgi:hypothetical protein
MVVSTTIIGGEKWLSVYKFDNWCKRVCKCKQCSSLPQNQHKILQSLHTVQQQTGMRPGTPVSERMTTTIITNTTDEGKQWWWYHQ